MSSHPRIVIAAPKSGSGKTTFTVGLLKALLERGLKAASFKCGPDYIDPMFHARILGVPSKNLDTFFTEDEVTRGLFLDGAKDADISVIEGVMGYYDGVGGTTDGASTYELAKVLKAPAILLMDVKGMSLSAVALIKGFMDFRKDSNITGVILNRCNPSTYPMMKKLIEDELKIKVFGYLSEIKDCSIDSRHLGLQTPDEIEGLDKKIQLLANEIKKTVDIPGLIEAAGMAPAIKGSLPEVQRFGVTGRIAVARDEAFCFYYDDNLSLLKRMGAELVFFSPLHDDRIPDDADAVYLGGGYPELYAKALSENTSMLESLKSTVTSGIRIYAECGGYMYLCKSMEDLHGDEFPMAGLIDAQALYMGRLQRFGYVELTGPDGQTFRAHEFHYFDTTDNGDTFTAQKPVTGRKWKCIHRVKNVIAGFPHIYFYSNPDAAYEMFR